MRNEKPISGMPTASKVIAPGSVPNGNSEYSDSKARNINSEPNVKMVPSRKRLQVLFRKSCISNKITIARETRVVTVFRECQPEVNRQAISLITSREKRVMYQISGNELINLLIRFVAIDVFIIICLMFISIERGVEGFSIVSFCFLYNCRIFEGWCILLNFTITPLFGCFSISSEILTHFGLTFFTILAFLSDNR